MTELINRLRLAAMVNDDSDTAELLEEAADTLEAWESDVAEQEEGAETPQSVE